MVAAHGMARYGQLGHLLDHDAVAVVDFVLDDLRRVSGERFCFEAELLILVRHLDFAPAHGVTLPCE